MYKLILSKITTLLRVLSLETIRNQFTPKWEKIFQEVHNHFDGDMWPVSRYSDRNVFS